MLPAPSQGIVGITCLETGAAVREFLAEVDHTETRAAAEAERALLRTLGGGCNVPVGALAMTSADTLKITARVLSIDGTREVAGERAGSSAEAASLGVELASDLMDRGATTLIEEARA
jgi:hydroxymethylbilane synthase